MPTCGAAEPEDWLEEIPYDPINLPGGVPHVLAAKVHVPIHEALGAGGVDPALVAPVGDQILAGPAIANSRAALR